MRVEKGVLGGGGKSLGLFAFLRKGKERKLWRYVEPG